MPLGSYKKNRNYAKMAKKAVAKAPAALVVNTAKVNATQTRDIIRKYIAGKIEQKSFANIDDNKRVIVSMTNTNAGNQIYLSNVFQCSQGTGEGNRVGNKVTLTKYMIRGFIHCDPQVSVPSYVRMLVVKNRDGTTGIVNGADLFNNGNSTMGPIPDFPDMLARINTDKYKLCYSKIFKVGPSGITTSAVSNPTNDFRNFRQFSINALKWFPKVIKYNDNTANPVLSQHPILFFIAVDWDGTPLTGTSQGTPGNNPFYTMSTEVKYTDL